MHILAQSRRCVGAVGKRQNPHIKATASRACCSCCHDWYMYMYTYGEYGRSGTSRSSRATMSLTAVTHHFVSAITVTSAAHASVSERCLLQRYVDVPVGRFATPQTCERLVASFPDAATIDPMASAGTSSKEGGDGSGNNGGGGRLQMKGAAVVVMGDAAHVFPPGARACKII